MSSLQVHKRRSPSVRLDIDISTIPPSSVQRRQFEEMFISDICKAIDIEDESVVEIYSIKPAVNMNWLIVVEFDVYVNMLYVGVMLYVQSYTIVFVFHYYWCIR